MHHAGQQQDRLRSGRVQSPPQGGLPGAVQLERRGGDGEDLVGVGSLHHQASGLVAGIGDGGQRGADCDGRAGRRASEADPHRPRRYLEALREFENRHGGSEPERVQPG